jgi:hypothetical protein
MPSGLPTKPFSLVCVSDVVGGLGRSIEGRKGRVWGATIATGAPIY